MVRNVFRNMCGLITKCSGMFSGMFGNGFRNVWERFRNVWVLYAFTSSHCGHCHQAHRTHSSYPHLQEQSMKGFATPKICWKNPQILGPSVLHYLVLNNCIQTGSKVPLGIKVPDPLFLSPSCLIIPSICQCLIKICLQS